MSKLFKRLGETELLELSTFLGSDAESYSLSELDGFFHGLLCLPHPAKPSEWIQEVLPESVAKTEQKLSRALDLTFRYHNAVADNLKKEALSLHLDGSQGESLRWTEGFGRGFGFDPDAVLTLADTEAAQVEDDGDVTIAAIVLAFVFDLENAPEDEDRDAFLEVKKHFETTLGEQTPEDNIELLTGLALTVYDLLEPVREQEKQSQATAKSLVKQAPKLGRNDPCYCNSGRKYKHCHGKPQNHS